MNRKKEKRKEWRGKSGNRREEKGKARPGSVTDRGLVVAGSDSWNHSTTGGGLAEN